MNASARRTAVRRGEYHPLVVALLAVCGGIVLDRYRPLSLLAWTGAAVAAWIVWGLLWRTGRLPSAGVALVVSLAATGAAWHQCHWSLYAADHVGLLARDVPAPVALEVRATGGSRRIPPPPPDAMRTIFTPERTRVDVEVLAVRDGDRWRPASGAATLSIDGNLRGLYSGDRVRVFAQLSSVRGPQNPGEFDFARQARGDRRLCWLRSEFPECVTTVATGSAWSWSRVTDWLRSRGDRLLWQYLGRQRAGLASAMFLVLVS